MRSLSGAMRACSTSSGVGLNMYLKVSSQDGKKIVAACDEELIGKVLEDGGLFLDLDTYASFYKGEVADTKKLKEELADCASANLVGEGPVGVAKELGLISDEDIMHIKDVPHVQIYRI